ncbi:membrane lipoprotein lipid attachment site-containing protein [Flavobacterium sp. MAH-1]|uniref:Membrane lipoprotein lipid attachment site-containing protein n=1 Tax=Flavobacterium agri TaxID=2743471 RepID=A0A7Y9C570_9FLAO|nr:DUF6252 family protein [Flavobacterium agri]NUY80641.1 membrane lipoprotein lipid attachment site-containing protein [Flavobacterium agri]NYA70665.1 membrane lipoprotein lipid attachment site-containing protein [Flavobacterium agri]
MKKIFLLLFTAVALSSCTEDIRDNSPSLEGLRNGSRWRAPGVTATLGSGGDLTISGGNQFETLTLNVPSANAATYTLGTSENKKATFVVIGDSGTKTFATGTGIGNGEIEIEVYDEVKRTITGTFRFNAIDEDAVDPENPTAAETTNFIEGHFYKVPVYPAL